MKNFITTAILIMILTSCKAQSPIVARDASFDGKSQGTYFKDLNNEFDKFIGTWLYTDGNTSLTIRLLKKEMVYDGSEYYFDELFGEYHYFRNGTEIINTLPSLQQNPDDIDNRSIGGGYIITNNNFIVACNDCPPNTRRIKLYFNDPERSYLSASIILRYIHGAEFGEPAKMKVTLVGGEGMIPNEDSPTETRVPYGEYVMIKQ